MGRDTVQSMGRLSKSRYQIGLQCRRALWRQVHARNTADPVTERQQWIFDQGHEVGELAQGLFPGGTEVTEGPFDGDRALRTTLGLIAGGVETLYEPAFEYAGVLVRVDILVRVAEGEWDLYEVKSSGSVKDQHITDAAVQTYVVEGAGLSVRRTHVVHLNTGYVYQGGEHDPTRLFLAVDVTDPVRDYLPQVDPQLRELHEMLAGPEPDMRIGGQCTSPYRCSFYGYCHDFLPDALPVTDLPRISADLLERLLEAGIHSIAEIPLDTDGLQPRQRDIVEAVAGGEPRIDSPGLAAALSSLDWPVYHLDFETVAPAVPLWKGTRPYEAVPFQYSIHVHHREGSHEHREFLHTDPGDPRQPLAESMLFDLEQSGSIIHYSPYERRIIDALTTRLPGQSEALARVRGRLFDLEPVIRRHTAHPMAGGRTSIKNVLPAWCPDMSYEGMAIADGQTASARYLKALRGLISEQESEAVYRELREYCALDTYAMARLLDELMRRSS